MKAAHPQKAYLIWRELHCATVTGTLLVNSTWSEIPVALQMINAGYADPAATLLEVVLPSVNLPCLLMLSGSWGHARIAATL